MSVKFEDLRIGQTIVYTTTSGVERHVRIDELERDIKDGRPGFAGYIQYSTSELDRRGDPVWGYADQIFGVIS